MMVERNRRRWYERRSSLALVATVCSISSRIAVGQLIPSNSVMDYNVTTNNNDDYDDDDQMRSLPTSFQKIVGGTPAPSNKYPWIGLPTSNSLCSGILIHADIVVTAAHCSGAFDEGLTLGGVDLYNADGTYHAVESSFVHPDFPAEAKRQPNDIMLLKLSEPSSAPVLEIASDLQSPYEENMLKVMGWGDTSEGGQSSSVLLEAEMPVSNFAECDEMYRSLLEDRMFCTGVPEGGVDACAGDSGGPLVNRDGKLVGLVFIGIGCAREGVSSVNTRISFYKEWIENGICTMSATKPEFCVERQGLEPTTSRPTFPEPSGSPTLSPSTSAPVTTAPYMAPVTSEPSATPVTSVPTNVPFTTAPSSAPITPMPSSALITPIPTEKPTTTDTPTKPPTKSPVTLPPSRSPATLVPFSAPITPSPTASPTKSHVTQTPSAAPTSESTPTMVSTFPVFEPSLVDVITIMNAIPGVSPDTKDEDENDDQVFGDDGETVSSVSSSNDQADTSIRTSTMNDDSSDALSAVSTSISPIVDEYTGGTITSATHRYIRNSNATPLLSFMVVGVSMIL